MNKKKRHDLINAILQYYTQLFYYTDKGIAILQNKNHRGIKSKLHKLIMLAWYN